MSPSVAAVPPLVVSDMDGTLTAAETWRAVLAWVVERHPSAAARRFVPLRIPLVVAAKVGLYDKERFRARWLEDLARLLRGRSADELAAMGEWAVERTLWPARREPAVRTVAEALAAARREDPQAALILASGAFQPVADAFARRLTASGAIGTPLEMQAGVATGRLATPVGSGMQKVDAVRARAGTGRVVAAFGDTAADIPLLELATRPVAVAPDRALRAVAEARGWEILAG